MLPGAGSQTTHTGSYNILPIFLQMAHGWSPFLAGTVLFCRPLGGFLISVLISRLMRNDKVPLHWLIRLGSLSQCCAFLALYFVAHRADRGEEAQLRPLIMVVLLLQAGGNSACNIPSQAILVARMPVKRLASIQRCAYIDMNLSDVPGNQVCGGHDVALGFRRCVLHCLSAAC